MDDATDGRAEHGPSTPGGVTDGLERPSSGPTTWNATSGGSQTMFDDMVNRQRGELSVRGAMRARVRTVDRRRERQIQGADRQGPAVLHGAPT